MTTGAESLLALARERASARSGEPAWLRRARAEAVDRFAELGLPTTRQEAWRFTSLKPLDALSFEDGNALAAPSLSWIDPSWPRLVFVDERLDATLSSDFRALVGVEVAPLSEQLRTSGDAALAPLLQLSDTKTRSLTALGTAIFRDGAWIRVAPGVRLEQPLLVVFASSDHARPYVQAPRCAISLGAGAQATVVEHHTGAGTSAESLIDAVTEIDLGVGAELRHVHLQEQPERAFHVAEIRARQAEGSRLRSASLALGGALARVEIATQLAGPEAHAELLGLYLGRGDQHLDHHTTIDHASPHTTSRELYKGILDGRAKGVFLGSVHVRPDAQKIDAQQSNRLLLLSDSAAVHTRPQLEIHANDVKCSHGASIGQIDPDALFYLRARGIDPLQARALLTAAFADDLLSELPLEPLRTRVSGRLTLPDRDLTAVTGRIA